MNLSLCPVGAASIDHEFLIGHPGRLVVWWYGPIQKGGRAASVPQVRVVFRNLAEDDSLVAGYETADVPLSYLGLLRIGSVWQGGRRVAIADYPEELFESLLFSEEGWSFSSFHEADELGKASPFPLNEYPLLYGRDQAVMLNFRLPDGKKLLVPCLEFFSRCYGRSAEVRRVLATYPWSKGKEKLLLPIGGVGDDEFGPGAWPVRLKRQMHNADVVFLAHLEHSSYALNAAKSIYAQTETVFSQNTRYVFPKVRPWFPGEAKIKAAGLWLAQGSTFLALRITGVSDPQGETVIREREVSEDFQPVFGDGTQGMGEQLHRIARFIRPPEIVDLTDAGEPDHGMPRIDLEDDEMEVLGEPRRVLDRSHAVSRGLVRRRVATVPTPRRFATGEPYGSGRGIGYVAIHTPAMNRPWQGALESKGVLRDMWNAARKLQQRSRGRLISVGWFTFETGVAYGLEPRLIAFKPYAVDAQVDASTKNWVYHDLNEQIPRGLLVMVIRTSVKHVAIVEIQRRLAPAGNADGNSVEEESLGGIVIDVSKVVRELRPMMQRLMLQISNHRGVTSRVVAESFERLPMHAFKHVSSQTEAFPCEVAVKNALSKVGIVL